MNARRLFSCLILLGALVAPIASAYGQAPPAVGSLPDSERRTAYSITSSNCACAINLQLFASGSDVDAWISVWVNGVRYLSTDATYGWSLSSTTGPLSTIPRPITNAVLTFNSPQTATVQIVGAERPRQLSQFQENQGVPARALNQRMTEITAVERELWDKTSDLSGRGLFFAPGNSTGPMPSPVACANLYLAFDASGLNPTCVPIIGTGSFVGVGQGLVNNSGTLSTALGIDANILNAQTGNYSVGPGDCSKTIYATGGQNTITLPSVSGFAATCSVLIRNGDTANGKILSGFPNSLGSLLYPRQTFGVKIENGVWSPFYAPGPWNPLAAITLFASSSGNDANDGLTAGTPITLATACSRRQTFFNPSAMTIQLADGTYSTPDSNGALCSIGGNSGGTSNTLTNLTGNCTTPTNVVLSIPDGDTGVFTKDLGEVEISCVTFQGAGSGVVIGVSGAQFSVADFQKTVWGSFGSGSVGLQVGQNASFNLVGTAAATINANIGTFISVASGGLISANSSTTIAIPSAVAWGTQFIQLYEGGSATLGGMTFTGSGVAGTTGKRATLIGPVFLATSAVACNTFFPGNASCTLVNGAQDDANDPPTAPALAGTTTFAALPTPVAGMYAYISDGKTTNCGDSSCTTFGTAVTGGAGVPDEQRQRTGAAWHLVGK